jgi:hypothetical protein
VIMTTCRVWRKTFKKYLESPTPKRDTTNMGKNKKKRKDNAPHARRPAPSERRQVISYDDIEGAAPPIPRQKVSYGSDSNDEDADHAPDQRHAVVSREALKERERPQTDVTYGQVGAFPGLDPRDKEVFYGPANDGLDYLRMVR